MNSLRFSTLKLAECPKEALELKKHVRQRAKSIGPRGMPRAIKEGRNWFAKKFPDCASIVQGLSDQTLRNFVTGKTGSIITSRFKR